jgi:hypothetical protein
VIVAFGLSTDEFRSLVKSRCCAEPTRKLLRKMDADAQIRQIGNCSRGRGAVEQR